MKKVFAIALTVVFAAGTMSSCKKCVTCTYTNDVGEEISAESCGKKNNENLQTDLEDQFGAYGSVNCVDQ